MAWSLIAGPIVGYLAPKNLLMGVVIISCLSNFEGAFLLSCCHRSETKQAN